MDASPFGVYVHVPFCGTACDYCAFYREEPRRASVDAWLAGVERELSLAPFPRVADTFFVGGGTPGVLSAEKFARLADMLVAANGGRVPAEWSVELAPGTVKADKLRVLRERGVNRISLGVQSFDAETLALLGRRHSPRSVFAAYEAIRAAGFDNVNLDLIFSVPGENSARWRRDLDTAVALAPEHLSAYCLILEDDAPLLSRIRRSGNFSPEEKSPEREAELYLETWSRLAEAGYAQYEVANHARPGRECIHNLNTWRMAEWLGYGPSAASQCGGRRFRNPADLARWLDALTEGVPAREDVVELSPRSLMEDAFAFGLRLAEGFDADALARRFGVPVPEKVSEFADALREEGYLESAFPRSVWRPTARGLLVADAVALRVLELFE
ncbi:MAG: radical SAM family heme chaperone HemW [Candidatus Spyradosoma sp.]